LELALPMLDGEQRRHHRLALVVGAPEEVSRVGQLLVDAVLSGAIPKNGEGACLLHHRTKRQARACRHDAQHAIDLFLLHQLLEALDGVLGARLLLDHQFDPAPGDAARGVELLHRPLGGAQTADAGAGSDAGAWRQNAELEGLGLSDGGGENAWRCSGSAGSRDRPQDGATGELHWTFLAKVVPSGAASEA